MGQLLLKTIVGALAGLAIWLLFEPMAPANSLGLAWDQWEMWFVLCLGAGIGLAVGGLNGWIQGSRTHLLRGAGLGLVFGAIGATLGHSVGGAIANAVFGPGIIGNPAVNIATATLARAVALTPIGIFLGAAIGASSLNLKRTIQGLIGGMIGAAVGALLFDTLSSVIGPLAVTVENVQHGQTAEIGAPARALYAVLLGGLIALFIGIVDLVSRRAWVRLVLGRNEGKEWPIDAPQTFIGRSEGVGVPLFGDPNVAPMHACITKQGGAYFISDGGSPSGTMVNGQRIQSAPLFSGAQIQIGSFMLQFLMKQGAAPARGPESFHQAYPIQNPPSPYPRSAPPVGPAPGSLYGSSPTQVMPAASGAFAAQTPVPQPLALTVIDGPMIGRRFPVGVSLELGRESAQVPMSYDSNASRRHASVASAPNGLLVTDLGSTNGTFVNGQRVQTANAQSGDVIRIGGTSFRVEPA